MVLRAIEAMPKAEKWVFIIRKEHAEKHCIKEIILASVPSAEFIEVEATTRGGLESALLAAPKMNEGDSAFISACDIAPEWDMQAFEKMVEKEKPSAVVITFEEDASKLGNPAKYSWVKLKGNGEVEKISLKKPVANGKGRAVAGSFYFASWKDFRKAAEGILVKGRAGQELHLEGAINKMLAGRARVLEFKVEKFICFGTPEELEEYLEGKRHG